MRRLLDTLMLIYFMVMMSISFQFKHEWFLGDAFLGILIYWIFIQPDEPKLKEETPITKPGGKEHMRKFEEDLS